MRNVILLLALLASATLAACAPFANMSDEEFRRELEMQMYLENMRNGFRS